MLMKCSAFIRYLSYKERKFMHCRRSLVRHSKPVRRIQRVGEVLIGILKSNIEVPAFIRDLPYQKKSDCFVLLYE